MKISTETIRKRKGKQAIVALTAYDALFAKYADKAEVDIILVGDSVASAQLGMSSTVEVTMETMVHHTAAVSRGVSRGLLVADIPFAEAHKGPYALVKSGQTLMQQGGAEAIKVEGGESVSEQIRHCVDAGIPVMGHIGLQPQQFHQLGGYRKFGKSEREKNQLLEDAKAIESAGAFSLVLELCTPELTAEICREVAIPVIAIGCRAAADGQILVYTDLLGLNRDSIPPFAPVYAELEKTIEKAYADYVNDVRTHRFIQ